ncbi:MAG: S9 family peptidase [Bacteroidota bacterium]
MSILTKKDILPPIAEKSPTTLSKHGDDRIDNYYWMKLSDEQKTSEKPDTQTQKVVDYLNAENDYRSKMMDHLEGFQDRLFEEIKGRIKQDDSSVPYKWNGYFYITRFEKGKEYPIYSRKKDNLDNHEEILLDVNVLAEPYEYYNVSSRSVSPDNSILAYGEDTVSRRQYTLRFKNLETGEMFNDRIKNTTGTAIWANDNKTIFYTRKDETLRSYKVFRHILGDNPENDVEVYHEEDDTFNAFVFKTKSRKYIVIGSWATLSQEFYLLDANHPYSELRLFQKRERKLEYSFAHYDDKFYIRTNKDGAYNFKIMVTPEDSTQKESWKDLIPHREDVLIEDVEIFKNYLVLNERVKGISCLRIMPWEGKNHYIEFEEEAYTSGTNINLDFDTDILRLTYTSMTTPHSIYDYNMETRALELKKQTEVLGDFDPKYYDSERLMVKARDGKEVPVSVVYKKGFQKDGKAPFLLYAYGSYGHSIDPYFSSVRLSLLDRGFGYAIAHIRGGQELGRQWYEDGKFLNKMNTFTDFIDVGDYLTEHNYTSKNQLFAMGGSAGGMLMGGIANMRPDLWKGIVAAVPFVDVVTTMLDESIPLTTGEYDEWGNPNDKTYYDYMKSYSPYDNVEKKDYPSILVTTGYHDSQVQYWEPAKWVAKLRELKADDQPILMYCNMDTGHGGASGRFRRFREVAMEYAYLLDLAGKIEM